MNKLYQFFLEKKFEKKQGRRKHNFQTIDNNLIHFFIFVERGKTINENLCNILNENPLVKINPF